jgi:hypothetical protein
LLLYFYSAALTTSLALAQRLANGELPGSPGQVPRSCATKPCRGAAAWHQIAFYVGMRCGRGGQGKQPDHRTRQGCACIGRGVARERDGCWHGEQRAAIHHGRFVKGRPWPDVKGNSQATHANSCGDAQIDRLRTRRSSQPSGSPCCYNLYSMI